jgi:hypothetical protein
LVTVITNLLSAIPWIGKDIVEFALFHFISLSFLPIIGSINERGLRGVKVRSANDKEYTSNISYAFLSMFVGLVDGDGYIAITKERIYVRVQLVLNLHLNDIDILKKIQSILKVTAEALSLRASALRRGRINSYPAAPPWAISFPKAMK